MDPDNRLAIQMEGGLARALMGVAAARTASATEAVDLGCLELL
jgi:hypothetical protein